MGSSISAPALSVRGAAHRRIQSQQVPSGPGFPGASNPPQNVNTFTTQGGGLGIDQAGVPRGHGRRHSVNVVNKGHASAPSQFFSYNGLEGFDDGFQPPPPAAGNGNHSRAQSRADSSWRISKSALHCFACDLISTFQMVVQVLSEQATGIRPTLLKHRRSSKASLNSALPLAGTTPRCPRSTFRTCSRI